MPAPEAAAFAKTVSSSLDNIAQAAAALHADATPAAQFREVRVIAPAAFAIRWLFPRLHRLQAELHGLTAVIRTTDRDEDWQSLSFDVGIRRGENEIPGLTRIKLMREMNTLVRRATTGMTAETATPAELPGWTFCEAHTRPGELDRWLALAGVNPADCKKRHVFPRFYLAAEAALAGVGALVGPVQILADELRDGKLEAPFPTLRLPGDLVNCVFDKRGERAEEARVFASWLARQAEITSEETDM